MELQTTFYDCESIVFSKCGKLKKWMVNKLKSICNLKPLIKNYEGLKFSCENNIALFWLEYEQLSSFMLNLQIHMDFLYLQCPTSPHNIANQN